MDTTQEQRLLQLSIGITLLLGALGIVFGLIARSDAIVFDGFYSFIDALMTVVSLAVARLLARQDSRRFQFGFWHLEPAVIALNGTLLLLACLYAVLTSIGSLLSGGRAIAFGPGVLYAALVAGAALIMAAVMRRKAARLQSDLLRLDARGWLIGGVLSLALLASFLSARLLTRIGYADYAPYADPLALAFLSLCVLPASLGPLSGAIRELLQIAPADLDREVRTVMTEMQARHGFTGFTSYVAKVGRARFIEIHIVLPPAFAIGSIDELDQIRGAIAARLGEERPERWLSIVFTGEPAWT
ncbi:cation diffusion facilitator family transporter [Marinivivus vitaminiproducens]|uniref:cation diffusion facilitator family transporter n=1 Tax=Marinivivus vitaminiproducens TaxID=3035935 RepID=UPI0027A7188E|nr:cation transporter [Geminicoccaceae bacterium SCSIO 64248]